jgi:hypothetical protein
MAGWGRLLASTVRWWRLSLEGGPPVDAPSGCRHAEVAPRSVGRNRCPASRRPVMATLLEPISSLGDLPMHYLQVRGVVGCYGKPFEEILIRRYTGVDIGDT